MGKTVRLAAVASAALVAATMLVGGWWSPEPTVPLSLVVVAGLGLVWLCSYIHTGLGAGLAVALFALTAFFQPPEFHLWGDGALRLRNLGQALPVMDAAPLEPGDYALRLMLVRTGVPPEDTYRITGVLGGAVYMTAALLLVGPRRRDRSAAAILTLAASPTWAVFFTGYVESYGILAGLILLNLAVLHSGRSSVLAAASALLASTLHFAGMALVPGTVIYALKASGGRERAAALVLSAIAVALPAALLLQGGSGRLPDFVQLPRITSKLALLMFAAPAIPVLLAMPGRGIRASALITALLFLAAFVLFPLERGDAIDWDLGGVLLLPLFAALLMRADGRLLPLAAGVAVIMAGPRTGGFLDPQVSEARFREAVEAGEDPSAYEELAIISRDRGDLAEAAGLLEEAFSLSGNGRHLAMLSEVERMSGRPGPALETSLRAVELRPDLETAWVQLAFAARDAGDAEEAFGAAEEHDARFPDHQGPGLWPVALETAVSGGHAELSWQAAQPLLNEREDPAILINLAGAAYLNGRMQTAAQLLLLASEASPENPLVLFNRGVVALELRDTLAAAAYLRQAVQIDPGMSSARELLETIRQPGER